MKKLAVAILALIMTISFAGCAGNTPTEGAAGFDGTMSALIDKIYENHKDIELSLITTEIDLTDGDMLSYQTGLSSDDPIAEAAISETMMGQPYSLVLVRAKSAADAAAIAQKMYDSIDTRKWICMEADTKTAAYCGDVAMFFMVDSAFADSVTTDSILDAFRTACTGEVSVIG